MNKTFLSILILISILAISCKNNGFKELEPQSSELEPDSLELGESRLKSACPWQASFSVTKSACGDYYDCEVVFSRIAGTMDTKYAKGIYFYLEDEDGRIIKNLDYRNVEGYTVFHYVFQIKAIYESRYYRVRLETWYGYTTDAFAYPDPYQIYTNKKYLAKFLPAPTNVITMYDGEDIEVSWDAVSGATGYKVYVSTDYGLTFEYISTVSSGYTSYGRELHQQYYDKYRYKVCAVKGCGESEGVIATRKVPSPRNVQEEYDGEDLTVSWLGARSNNVKNYNLYVSTDSGQSWILYRILPYTATSYTRELSDNFLPTYWSKVSAVYDFGESDAILAPK